MRLIELERKTVDLKEYAHRSAIETDFDYLITDDTLILHDGKPAVLYIRCPWEFGPLRKILQGIKYQTTTRSGGLRTTSRVFGFQPRIALRRDFCTATSLANEEKNATEIIRDYGLKFKELYKAHFPDVYAQHEQWAQEKVRDEWKIKGTPFTSGIINKNNPLKYHFDAGNIKNVMSCMVGIKHNVGGGHLSIPELGVGLEICDQSLTIFDGQSWLHGVTPIKKLSANAYRYTVVYYTLHQMWKCEELTKEVARIREKKTERERKRVDNYLTRKAEAELRVTQHGTEEGEVE